MFLNESLKNKPLYKVKEEMNQIGKDWTKKLKQMQIHTQKKRGPNQDSSKNRMLSPQEEIPHHHQSVKDYGNYGK